MREAQKYTHIYLERERKQTGQNADSWQIKMTSTLGAHCTVISTFLLIFENKNLGGNNLSSSAHNLCVPTYARGSGVLPPAAPATTGTEKEHYGVPLPPACTQTPEQDLRCTPLLQEAPTKCEINRHLPTLHLHLEGIHSRLRAQGPAGMKAVLRATGPPFSAHTEPVSPSASPSCPASRL